MANAGRRVRTARAHLGGDEGASAVEYALIVASIAAVIVLIVVALGAVVNNSMKSSCDTIKQTLNTDTNTHCTP